MERVFALMKNHLVLSGFYKALSGMAMLVSVALLLKLLGESDFGVWILIFTLFQWILLMDFGLASLLKTKIPELKFNEDLQQINAYIGATYKSVLVLAGVIFLLFFILVNVLDLKQILNIDHSADFVNKLFTLNIFFFCVNFIANTHKSLFVAVLKGKYSEQSIAVNQILFLGGALIIFICCRNQDNETKLYIVSITNGLISLLTNCIYTLFFFKTQPYAFTIKNKTGKIFFSEIYRLGGQYMLSQLAIVFLFSADGYILSYFYKPNDVVPYEIVTKYFQFPLMILIAAMAPLWSLFTKHYLEKDKIWLLRAFRKFNYYFAIIIVLVCICMLLCPFIIKLWIGKSVNIPLLLIITAAFTTVLRIHSFFYIYFFNGIGKMKNYLILLAVSIIIKIPLSYMFITKDYGISSVLMASSVFLILWSVYFPIQAKKMIADI